MWVTDISGVISTLCMVCCDRPCVGMGVCACVHARVYVGVMCLIWSQAKTRRSNRTEVLASMMIAFALDTSLLNQCVHPQHAGRFLEILYKLHSCNLRGLHALAAIISDRSSTLLDCSMADQFLICIFVSSSCS